MTENLNINQEIVQENNLDENLINNNIKIELVSEQDVFVYQIKNSLLDKVCDNIIERFDTDPRIIDGITFGGLNKDIKNTKDLFLSKLDDWKDIDNILCKTLHQSLILYFIEINKLRENVNFIFSNISDKGYQIQRYTKNDGFYIFHNDANTYYDEKETRFLTYLWYLNDVEEGGETLFMNYKVKPEKGKLLFFPATWTYAHSGNMPISNDKYIITGWCTYKY